MELHHIQAAGIRDLAPDVLRADGHPKIMSAGFYADTTRDERALLAVRNGLYCLPTIELIEWLTAFIAGRDAIEIGAGNGVIAAALGIPATDNWLQADPTIRILYEGMKQPPVKYGAHVEKLTAREAVRKHRPRVVVASWVTHIYDKRRHEAGGNMFGVDELDVLEHCEHYVFIGNTKVHSAKPLWNTAPELYEHPDWLYSRAFNGSPDFIAVWKGKRT